MPPRRQVPSRWRRTLALAAAAALVGAPLLMGSAANAEPVDTATFNGGCGLLGLGSRSAPDLTELSVPAGADLRFVNRLGQRATLLLDGEPAADVASGRAAEVTFHEGPVTVSMQISCRLGQPVGAVVVEVTAVVPPSPPPATAVPEPPTDSPTTSPPSAGDGSYHGGSTGSGQAGSGHSGSPYAAGSASSPAGGAVPGGSGPSGPADGWSTVPEPPPSLESAVPADGSAIHSGHGDELSSRWGEDLQGSGVAPDRATVNPAPNQLSHTAQPAAGDGSIGLLALVATVCVVGVSAGAIRAIISQRSNRAEWA